MCAELKAVEWSEGDDIGGDDVREDDREVRAGDGKQIRRKHD